MVDEPDRMILTKRQSRLATGLIGRWRDDGIVDAELAGRLAASFEAAQFNWHRLARIAILSSLICFIVAAASFFADQAIVRFLQWVFGKIETALCVVLAAFAGGFYVAGFRRRKTQPEKIYTNEGLMFLGVVATAASVYYLGQAIRLGSEDFSTLILIACVVYGALGIWARSKLIWVFALLSLGGWFGAKTAYASGWGAYYFGMNYPLRFVLFGVVLCALGYSFTRNRHLSGLTQTTLKTGMLYLFMALWLLSIFGNYGDANTWRQVSQIELFHWSILFALAACAAIWHGLKLDNPISHGFGITFLFINIYTRFFEHFWDTIHKAIFFAVIGVSLWALGANAQRIWNLGRARELREERP